MITLADVHQGLASQPQLEYRVQVAIDLHKTSALQGLVTQAAPGRHLQILAMEAAGEISALMVQLCEDDYGGWIAASAAAHLQRAPVPYQPVGLDRPAIGDRLSQVIAFTHQAMAQPNQYLWGGTVGPNYDCSGLMQTAFASAGIRLPRDSYQQEAFTQKIALDALEPGDLIFFGQPRTNHVALYLGNGQYIHSSGQDQGRNGIGIDSIWQLDDPISRTYAKTLRGGGRVIQSYQPKTDQNTGNGVI